MGGAVAHLAPPPLATPLTGLNQHNAKIANWHA